jgi:N-acetylglucosamine-6-sulfatase
MASSPNSDSDSRSGSRPQQDGSRRGRTGHRLRIALLAVVLLLGVAGTVLVLHIGSSGTKRPSPAPQTAPKQTGSASGTTTTTTTLAHSSWAAAGAGELQPAVPPQAVADPALDNVLAQQLGPGWIAGDSAYSTVLPDGRVAFAFSDSYIGTTQPDGIPTFTGLVHSSELVGTVTNLQSDYGGTYSAPQALIPDTFDPSGIWETAATYAEGDSQMIFVNEYKGPPGILTLRYDGRSGIAVMAVNGSGLPQLSSVALLPADAVTTWGSATMTSGGYRYVYGAVINGPNHSPTGMKVARVSLGQSLDIGLWTYWNGSRWVKGESNAVTVPTGNDLTGVVPNPEWQRVHRRVSASGRLLGYHGGSFVRQQPPGSVDYTPACVQHSRDTQIPQRNGILPDLPPRAFGEFGPARRVLQHRHGRGISGAREGHSLLSAPVPHSYRLMADHNFGSSPRHARCLRGQEQFNSNISDPRIGGTSGAAIPSGPGSGKKVNVGIGRASGHHSRRDRPRWREQPRGSAGLVVAFLALVTFATPVLPQAAGAASSRPNIVFILTDDLSWNLITPTIAPHIFQLEHEGETFTNYYVADSLCCPSRATIFTGLFPHDTQVTTNLPPYGGYTKFLSRGLSKKTFAVALQAAGYKTSLLGKYLNGYGDTGSGIFIPVGQKDTMTKANAPVPPGWNDWHVSNNTGYNEFNYYLNDNGHFHFYPRAIGTYGVDVLNRDAQKLIEKNAHHSPFVVEAATFAPHVPYTPAPRNADDFPGMTEPRNPSFGAQNTNPPGWLGQRPPLTAAQVQAIDGAYRERAQSVESVDKLLADTEATLAREGIAKNTYIVFSSDNGYHLGQHRILEGKETAFDTDIRVPLIVAGPGVPRGKVVPQVTQNVDLNPTFQQLGGVTLSRSIEGRSLVSLLHPSKASPPWRTVALLEHQGDTQPGDPDFQGAGSNPPSYDGIRVQAKHLSGFRGPVDATWVEYDDPQHEIEYYNDAKDPFQLHNIAGNLTKAQRTTLDGILVGLRTCHSTTVCWRAGLPQ